MVGPWTPCSGRWTTVPPPTPGTPEDARRCVANIDGIRVTYTVTAVLCASPHVAALSPPTPTLPFRYLLVGTLSQPCCSGSFTNHPPIHVLVLDGNLLRPPLRHAQVWWAALRGISQVLQLLVEGEEWALVAANLLAISRSYQNQATLCVVGILIVGYITHIHE
jgi:hypothetical protein